MKLMKLDCHFLMQRLIYHDDSGSFIGTLSITIVSENTSAFDVIYSVIINRQIQAPNNEMS